jgi:hypothetical protein
LLNPFLVLVAYRLRLVAKAFVVQSVNRAFVSAQHQMTVNVNRYANATRSVSASRDGHRELLQANDLIDLHFSLGLYIRNRLLYPRNERLLESCREAAMDKYLHWDQASGVIIKKLWEELRETHKLRIVD